jgi:arylformamidase
MKLSLLCAASVLVACPSLAAEPNVQRDLVYGASKDERQTLDVYSPPKGKGHPIVVWIHGGGWRTGDKRSVLHKPQAFVNKGFVFVSINYRFVPQVTLKEMTGDVAQAIRYVHDHAVDFGGQATSLFVMGHSAGAHLAALVCTDDRYLQAEGLSLSVIKGCVPVDTAAYDVVQRFANSSASKTAAARTVFGADAASHRELSPLTYVGAVKSIPPFLILHVASRPDSTAQSQLFAKALIAAGISASTFAAEGKTHGTINSELGVEGDKPTQALFEFVAKAQRP